MNGTTTVSITGKDTIIIAGRNLTGLADGDVGTLTHPNDIMVTKTGKNGNTLYASNAAGRLAEMVLRVIRGSVDDRYLNSLLQQQEADPSLFVLLTGTFIKRSGDGTGRLTNDTYVLTGGTFSKLVDAASNVEGNTDQSVAVYNLRWGNAPRALM